jgi:ribosomal protein S18 acetylase RimI-like enzyme
MIFQDFTKSFSPERAPNLKLRVCPITSENSEEVADNVAASFCTTEPLCVLAELEAEALSKKKYVHLALRNAKESLGLACFNEENGEFVAACLFLDMYNKDSEPFYTETDKKIDRTHIIFKKSKQAAEKYPGFKPSKKYEALHFQTMAVNPKYAGKGIGTELVRICLNEHPIIKEAKLFDAEAMNEFSKAILQKNGFKIFWTKPYQEYFQEEPELDFLKVMDEYNHKQGIEIMKNLYVMILDRTNENTLKV